MKRGTPRHPKTQHLIELLGQTFPKLPKSLLWPLAIGYLELLWHFCAEFAPQGNIGKFSHQRIEAACGWHGPVGKLIECLTTSGWLDVPEEHHKPVGLLIHDWCEHADRNVRRKLYRSHLNFQTLSGEMGVTWEPMGTHLVPMDAHPEPEPAPEPEPEPAPTVEKEEATHTHMNSALGARAEPNPNMNGNGATVPALKRLDEFLARYPDKSDPEATARAYARCVTPATEDACHACLARYNASDRVARNVVQRGRNWLDQQSRNGFHGEWAGPPPVQRKTVGFEESVTRVLAERIQKRGKPW